MNIPTQQKVIAFKALCIFLVHSQPDFGYQLESISSAMDLAENDVRQIFGFCLFNTDCNQTNFEVCNFYGRCDCHPSTQFNYVDFTCRLCPPGPDVACSECCTRANYRCVNGMCLNCMEYEYPSCKYEIPSEDSDIVYVTASQIALSAALIMGSVALITLLYRMCSKPATSQRPNIPRTDDQSTFQRLSQRLSLNSIQIRVLTRLQDRPPKYETQHNYDTRVQLDRERQHPDSIVDPNGATSPPLPVVSTNAIYVAPPAYDDGRYSLSDLPPPYSPALQTADHHPTDHHRRVDTLSETVVVVDRPTSGTIVVNPDDRII